MIDTPLAVALLLGALAVFVAIGVRGGPSATTVDEHAVARGTQGALTLGLSFAASGLGAWILFAPAELGALLGTGAVVGYALAAAGPFVVLAVLGPRLRRLVPSGSGLTELLRARFGPGVAVVVAAVSVLYMGAFLAAELVAVGGLAELLGGVPREVTSVAVLAATLGYTAYGGLRASLATDRWQGLLVGALLVAAAVAALASVDQPVAAMADSGLLGVESAGVTTALTLILAVTAANLLHHGYWQRVWAARDDRALRRGAWLGAGGSLAAMLIAGGLGVLAAGAGLVEQPSLALFSLAGQLPTLAVAGVLLLGVALVASSVDTLESALAALLVVERPTLRLPQARLATVWVIAPAALLALAVDSVLRLFLVADLLCAALIGPALLGLWRRASAAGVIVGAAAGLAGAVLVPAATSGSLAGGLLAASFPDAAPTLAPFAGAVLAGSAVTALVSLAAPTGGAPAPERLEARVRTRTETRR